MFLFISSTVRREQSYFKLNKKREGSGLDRLKQTKNDIHLTSLIIMIGAFVGFSLCSLSPAYCLLVVRGKGILFDFIFILLLAAAGAMFNSLS